MQILKMLVAQDGHERARRHGAEKSSFGVADGQDRQARVNGDAGRSFAIRAERDAVGFGRSGNVMQRRRLRRAKQIAYGDDADEATVFGKHENMRGVVETLADQPRPRLAGAFPRAGHRHGRHEIAPHGLAVRLHWRQAV